ncbi:MAG: flavodoxin [Ruminococcus sp.]|nr:flavodoxin [Ruminococcus sp.]
MKKEVAPKNLVAYYSASGTTEKIVTYIADVMNADLFKITPVNKYTDSDLNWTDSESRVVREHNDLENVHVELIKNTPDNFDTYDNIFIGYPIWWQEASRVVNDFVTENDFTVKNVIPFCTSMSSPLGESGTKLAEKSGTGNWLDGIRFTSRSSAEDVQKWAEGLDLTKPVTSNKTLIAYLSELVPIG